MGCLQLGCEMGPWCLVSAIICHQLWSQLWLNWLKPWISFSGLYTVANEAGSGLKKTLLPVVWITESILFFFLGLKAVLVFFLTFYFVFWYSQLWASQMAPVVKKLPANAGDIRDTGSVPELGSHGGGYSNPLQNSCLENPMDREKPVGL